VAQRPVLSALARRFGILGAYTDQKGVRRPTPDATRVALLAAMGVEAATEDEARRALRVDQAAARRRLLPPVQVTAAPGIVDLNLRAFAAGPPREIEWEAEIRPETGTALRSSGALRPEVGASTAAIPIPRGLDHGYHWLHVTVSAPRQDLSGAQRLILTPRRCPLPSELLGRRKVFGLLANLYTVRSRYNWGAGDLNDLRELVAWGAEIGAAFVGVNPLHAVLNQGANVSPYSPVSRLYRNVLYLDIGAVPELAHTPAAREAIAKPGFQTALDALRARGSIDYEQVLTHKLDVLRLLHRTFVEKHREGDTARGRAYRRYQRREGDALLDFATFLTLQSHFTRRGGSGDWRRWPAPYRRRDSPEVSRFRRLHANEIDFHSYLQFEIDRQLGAVAAAAQRQGMPIGVYQDLALGSASDGSDAWAFADLFAGHARIGAPPDDYNAGGQNWALPPLDPRRLAETGYEYFVRVVRAGLRHAGALRIDHVMGLLRQYWIPEGFSAAAGAYVRFPAADLFGILALESTRANALVVGEDLGTVPPELPGLLRRWGVLSTRVLYFERDRRGGFRPAHRYPRRALVTANTHDLAPLAGFWSGRDLELRRSLGVIPSDAALRRARMERERDRAALWRRLSNEGVQRGTEPRADALAAAVHAFLGRTPSALAGVSLDDLGGETEPVNVPGVAMNRHRSWSRRMKKSLEILRSDPQVQRALGGMRRRRWRKQAVESRPKPNASRGLLQEGLGSGSDEGTLQGRSDQAHSK
jgi:4-alpha-glucanotransferase